MFARTFEYTDYNGQPRKDTWWFNLTKAELMKMELGAWGGLDALLKRLIREENPAQVVDMFEKIILSAVGEKSPDGRRFIKNEEIRQDFYQTQAYSDLFYELVTDSGKVAAFLKGCIPADLAAKIDERDAQMAAEAEKAEATPLEKIAGGEKPENVTPIK